MYTGIEDKQEGQNGDYPAVLVGLKLKDTSVDVMYDVIIVLKDRERRKEQCNAGGRKATNTISHTCPRAKCFKAAIENESK